MTDTGTGAVNEDLLDVIVRKYGCLNAEGQKSAYDFHAKFDPPALEEFIRQNRPQKAVDEPPAEVEDVPLSSDDEDQEIKTNKENGGVQWSQCEKYLRNVKAHRPKGVRLSEEERQLIGRAIRKFGIAEVQKCANAPAMHHLRRIDDAFNKKEAATVRLRDAWSFFTGTLTHKLQQKPGGQWSFADALTVTHNTYNQLPAKYKDVLPRKWTGGRDTVRNIFIANESTLKLKKLQPGPKKDIEEAPQRRLSETEGARILKRAMLADWQSLKKANTEQQPDGSDAAQQLQPLVDGVSGTSDTQQPTTSAAGYYS